MSDGDWIEVKTRLSHGEMTVVASSSVKAVQSGGEVTMLVDANRLATARIDAWVTDWSFRDENDKPVAFSRDAILALDPDTAAEIDAALDKHVEALEMGKAPMNGATQPPATSR